MFLLVSKFKMIGTVIKKMEWGRGVWISISRGLRSSWQLRPQISLDYYTIPPATQASFSSFSIFHVNVDIKISRKKNSALWLHFFSLDKCGWPCNLPPKRAGCLKCEISPQLTWRGAFTYVRTIFSEPKFLGCIDNQIFLPMVLRYRARNTSDTHGCA